MSTNITPNTPDRTGSNDPFRHHPGFKAAGNPNVGGQNTREPDPPISTSIPMYVHPTIINIPDVQDHLRLSDNQTPDASFMVAQTGLKAIYEKWTKLIELRKAATTNGQITPGLEEEYLKAVDRVAASDSARHSGVEKALRSAIESQQADINEALTDKRSRPEIQAEIRSVIRSAIKNPHHSSREVRNGECFSRIQSFGLPGVAAALAAEHAPLLSGLDEESMVNLRRWAEGMYAPKLVARRKALEILVENHGRVEMEFSNFVASLKAIKVSPKTKATQKLRGF